jgi:hypothetical protein
MREFVVDLTGVSSFQDFVAAFNEGFCRHVEGEWKGANWNAFNGFLSWPDDERFRLVFRGWERAVRKIGRGRQAGSPSVARLLRTILRDNPHVEAVFD